MAVVIGLQVCPYVCVCPHVWYVAVGACGEGPLAGRGAAAKASVGIVAGVGAQGCSGLLVPNLGEGACCAAPSGTRFCPRAAPLPQSTGEAAADSLALEPGQACGWAAGQGLWAGHGSA